MSRSSQSWVFLLIGLTLIAAYSFDMSHNRIMWSDELFGWMLITDPSWAHMVHAWKLGADGGGLCFYAAARVWTAILGDSPMVFRAFSATGIYLALVAAWFSLRHFYRPLPLSLALLSVWFGSRTVAWQMYQIRFYGMLLAAVCGVFWVVLRSARETDSGRSNRALTLFYAAVISTLLVGTHPFGLLYSVLILLGAVVDDVFVRRKRPFLYLTIASSWLFLMTSREAMRSSAAVGKPWFWTVRPSVRDLFRFYVPAWFPFSVHRPPTVFVASVLLLLLLSRKVREKLRNGFQKRHSVLLLACPLFLVPLPVWLISRHGTSYWVDRYLIGFAVGAVVCVAELLSGLDGSLERIRPSLRHVTSLVVTTGVVFFIVRDCIVRLPAHVPLPPRDFTRGLASMLPAGEPVVVERVDEFDLLLYYQGRSGHTFVFPLDLESAVSPLAQRELVSGEREMENWKKAGYYASQIVPSADFLRTTRSFAVVSGAANPWLELRLRNKPEWQVTRLGVFEDAMWSATIWQVDHR